MSRTQTQAQVLAGRLCRPQRIGVFGHRGVGKTTFVTMLYREAVGGRLPELRLAAADARTAEYLADKILQLEAGQPLPGTLAETDLHFHLYHRGSQLDLLLRDYQGEHVAVGREEPIRDFLRDCDAVWLCLDVTAADTTESCLRSEQEVEQLVEDYLAAQPPGTPHRPMALVLTKADLASGGRQPPGDPDRGTSVPRSPDADRFAMTRHALASHCPGHALLAVSSLGRALEPAGEPVELQPLGLAEPLLWLCQSLQAQDEARLEQIWRLEPHNLPLLRRCVDCFARRHPGAPATRAFRARLRQLRRRRLRQRVLAGTMAILALWLSLWGYDAWGQGQARRFAGAHPDEPEAVRTEWQRFQFWHPTRFLFLPTSAHDEGEQMRLLDELVRQRQCSDRLADLRRRAADPDANPEAVWDLFQDFRAAFPERDVHSDMQEFRNLLKARRDAERERRAETAFQELLRQESQLEPAAQLARAERFLKENPDTKPVADVQRRVEAYLRRLDEQAFEAARAYSTRQPFNFHSRREYYQAYLQRHPQGAFAKEAAEAIRAVDREWDRHDFRTVRDHFQDHPGELKELEVRCRGYLSAHPHGQFHEPAAALLRWAERVRGGGEYRVKVVSGSFDPKSAGYFSRGLSLSVELEVNGVSYGPSTIEKRTAEPEWNYEFPRAIRWKPGDSVRVKVTDHYYWRRTILDVSEENDPLALRLLCGTVASGKHSVVFESDFAPPVLPAVE
jgi:hypothetical protein